MNNGRYAHADEVTTSLAAASRIIPHVLEIVGPTLSAVDVGGGTGAWLSVLQNFGVDEILLYDTEHVKPQLLIDQSCFRSVDLNRTMPSLSNSHFDLAICLECAEHLHPSRSAPLVKTLTSCTDVVLFSAATPGQPGKGHINLQFPEFWRRLFDACGFVRYDVIRPRILWNREIPYWYRQNLFLFCKTSVNLQNEKDSFLPADFELFYGPNLHKLAPGGFLDLIKELGPSFTRVLQRRSKE